VREAWRTACQLIELEVSQAGFERIVEFVRQTHALDGSGHGAFVALAAANRPALSAICGWLQPGESRFLLSPVHQSA
jgi:hypothetical protein